MDGYFIIIIIFTDIAWRVTPRFLKSLFYLLYLIFQFEIKRRPS